MNMDDNSFVKSFFMEEGATMNHALSHTQHRPRTRTESPFNENDLFSGYTIEDPLADVKHDAGSQGGMFEPLDHTHAPLTPLHKVDFVSYPGFHDFELRVPQLASTPNSSFEPVYTSFMPHGHHHNAPSSSTAQFSVPQNYQQPYLHPAQVQPSSFVCQDSMGGLRANTTISTSPAIEVRKFPVDPDFRRFQLGSHVLPPPVHHHRSVSDYAAKPPQPVLKVPLQRATTVPAPNQQVVPPYKSKGKRCTENGCTRRAQSNNRCKAHGGGARCQHPDCPKSSQGGGFCRAHGGGKKCEFAGCTKGQQRKGFCYAHGGIRKCKHAQCDKKDRGNGYCIAHGGGKRCTSDGCMNAVRKGRFCRAHLPAGSND
ncbi:hypothetical protein H310_00387 [Aphanomyces invadans]|uniref:WRKY19-like zinc finger domain-containing protein n=1 Tax=Aphanomyces invadans TaxID=157072 RepID=A0A024UTY6_9STRA|nr:hypothetical protein H310_00387 [Aphanomyces invadans]ETW09971.1 hypothetical protein H310_00387 [Aphanomyces invadans]|eukprot:XP_008861382.1 hypothetical protein H310_00387 [Aphanomyces invadans]